MNRNARIINGIILAAFLFAGANIAWAKVDPYSYKNRYLMPVYEKTFVTPSSTKTVKPKSEPLPDVAPRTPAVSIDSNGNVTIKSPGGKFSTRIDKQGNTESFKSGQTQIKRDYQGDLTETREFEGGSNLVTIKNEFGETTGFEEYGLGGKVLRTYDEDHNLTATMGYDRKTRSLSWVVDQLTFTRTIYGRYNKALYDVDFEGNKTAFYEYNGNNKVKWKIDLYGNKTIYDDHGQKALVTLDFEGNVIAAFNYDHPQSEYRLTSIADQYGNVTIYEKGRPRRMQDSQGSLLKEWVWQGTKLIMTKDIVTNNLLDLVEKKVTWYKNNKPTHTTVDGVTVKNWIRFNGGVIGTWNVGDKELTLIKNGRLIATVYLKDLSDIDQVEIWLKNNWA